jgi:hypothetical protein
VVEVVDGTTTDHPVKELHLPTPRWPFTLSPVTYWAFPRAGTTPCKLFFEEERRRRKTSVFFFWFFLKITIASHHRLFFHQISLPTPQLLLLCVCVCKTTTTTTTTTTTNKKLLNNKGKNGFEKPFQPHTHGASGR